MRGYWDRLSNTRGVSLVLVAISLVAIMGMAALAIDLGMLLKVRAEAQRAADAAALAGASAFLLDQPRAAESTLAVTRAYRLADTNYMAGAKIDTTSEVTVKVLWDSSKVRVRVRRAAIPIWFAQVFGVFGMAQKSFPVGAKAAAVADYASGTKCVKPLAMADMWDDVNGDINPRNQVPDVGETWLYARPPDIYNRANYDPLIDGSGTGYGSAFRDPTGRDWGYRIVLRPSVNGQGEPCPGTLQGNKCFMPGWWGLWGGQTKTMVDMMAGCDTTTRSVGVPYDTEAGWRGPIAQAEGDVYNMDPGAQWNGALTDAQTGKLGTVTGSSYTTDWRASPRVWIMAIFDPNLLPAKANATIRFNNFMLFFFEGCMNNNGTGQINANCGPQTLTIGRFLGIAAGTATGPSPGTMIRILRLVE